MKGLLRMVMRGTNPELMRLKCRTIGSKVEYYELKDELWEIQSQYESVLNDSTTFPRAGSTNQRYFSIRRLFNQKYSGICRPSDGKLAASRIRSKRCQRFSTSSIPLNSMLTIQALYRATA